MKNIIGHNQQIKQLDNIIESQKISNAYIFYGIDGIGKKTIAKEFAKKILGNDNYIFIEPEENVIKVDTIRALKEELMLKPIVSDRKIAIIDNAQYMNEQAQNALLKILEDPPEYVTIILITSNKEKLLYTIKSRCIEIKFNALNENEIRKFFDESIEEDIIKYSRGSIGAIIKAKESGCMEVVSKWVQAFRKDDLIELTKDINILREEQYVKENMTDFLNFLIYEYYNSEEKTTAVEAIEIIEECRRNISRNANVDIAVDKMVIDLWKWRKRCKKL